MSKTTKPASKAATIAAAEPVSSAPPANDEHVAPGASLFSDSTKRQGVRHLAQARALPECADPKAALFETDDPTHILAFMAEDGRVMRVVQIAGGLAARATKA